MFENSEKNIHGLRLGLKTYKFCVSEVLQPWGMIIFGKTIVWDYVWRQRSLSLYLKETLMLF